MGLDAELTDQMTWRTSAAEPDWNTVFTEQLPRVYNYFRYRLGNEADIQELTSRTFEKAWRARRRYRRERAGMSTWLLRIAHNVAIDHFRLSHDHAPLEVIEDSAVDIEVGPELEHENASDMARLQALIPTLPTRER